VNHDPEISGPAVTVVTQDTRNLGPQAAMAGSTLVFTSQPPCDSAWGGGVRRRVSARLASLSRAVAGHPHFFCFLSLPVWAVRCARCAGLPRLTGGAGVCSCRPGLPGTAARGRAVQGRPPIRFRPIAGQPGRNAGIARGVGRQAHRRGEGRKRAGCRHVILSGQNRLPALRNCRRAYRRGAGPCVEAAAAVQSITSRRARR
jgi:hypothetical protein